MAGTSLGSAYVQIVPSAEGIKGSITDVLGGEAESAGASSGAKIAAFAKKAIKAAAIGKFLKDSLQQGAELEQNIGGAHAVFGDALYSQLETRAKEAYKNMGLSASDYYATANKMGSLFQGSGIDQQKSLELTTSAMQRAADVASVMGIDTSMAMESIAGAAKGNFTMMDNLGVAMNATTLAAYALEKGINFDWNTASNAEKAELAMQMFMDRTSQYAGNFARESADTFSGSLGALKASYQNFVGSLAIGENIQGALDGLITSISNFAFNNLIPMIGNIVKALPGAIVTFIQQGVPALLSGLSGVVSSIADSIKSFADDMSGAKIAEWAQTMLPKLVASAATMLGGFVKGLLGNIGVIVAAIGKIGAAIVTGLGSALWGKVKQAANGIKEKFLAPIQTLRDKIKAIVDKIKGFFSFKIKAPHVPLPHFSISPAGWKIGDLLKGTKPSLSVKWYAEGGILKDPTLFGAGEAGPEGIIPLSGAAMRPFARAIGQEMDGGRGDITINLYYTASDDASDMVRDIARNVKLYRMAGAF